MIIIYKVRLLLGINNLWVTEISHLREKEFFVDEQRIGPYSLTHHQHFITPIEKGVQMKDIVTYKPPFGFIGAMANKLIIDTNSKKYLTIVKKLLKNDMVSMSDTWPADTNFQPYFRYLVNGYNLNIDIYSKKWDFTRYFILKFFRDT